MATQKIKIKRSSTTAVPTVEFGELAITDIGGKVKVFGGNSTNAPIEIAGDGKMNVVSSPVANNLLITDATGQAIDSGKKFDDTGTTTNDILSAAAIIEQINAQKMGSSSGYNFFLSDADVGSFKSLTRTAPNGSQAIATISVSSTTPVLLRQFISAPLGITSLDSDLWTFNLFASCSVIQNTSNITVEVYKCSDITGSNLTLLFTASNGDINSLTPVRVDIEKTEPSYSLLATDCILIKVLASTTHNNAVNVSLYYNDQDTNSHIHTPIKATHNQLQGLNEGDFLHLSALQKTSATRYANTSQDGLLSNTDWNTFNNKQNLIASPTNNNIVFTNSLGQTVDSGYAIETSLTGNANLIPNSSAVQSAIQIAQQGLDAKQSTKAATIIELNVAASGNGVGKTLTANVNGVLSMDNVSIWTDVVNDGGSTNPYETTLKASRVLVKNQLTGADNGIYVVTNKGSSTAPFVLTRAIDANNGTLLNAQAYIFVENGNINANAGFTLANPDPIIIDTTALTFVQFSGAGSITAGDGLTKSGNTLSALADIISINSNVAQAVNVSANGLAVKVDNSTITGGGATSLSVKNQGITATQIANATITTTQISATANITGSQLSATAGITGGQLANTTITSANIVNNTITGTQIATNTIANTNLAQAGANTWKGNNTNATANVSDNLTASLTEATSSVLTISGGANAVLNATSIEVKQATTSQSGYLSNTDWNTFNNKVNKYSTQTLSSTSSITAWNSFVNVSGTSTITLPAIVPGLTIKILKIDSSTTTTILPASGTINGAASYIMSNQYEAIVIASDGVNYQIISDASPIVDGGTF